MPNNQISAQSRTIGGSGTAVNTSYSYDSADRQTTITDYLVFRAAEAVSTPLATYLYSYDNANRVTTMVDAEGTYTYTYDNANELTSVYKGGTQVGSYTLRREREPNWNGILDHGDERDADFAGRHLHVRFRREHDQRQ